MDCRPLKIIVISAKGLKDVNVFGKMDVYVRVSLSSNGSNIQDRTPIHKGGSTNPQWGHTLAFPFDEAADRVARLKFKIKAKRTLRRDKEIGEVDVPVGELLENGGVDDGEPKVLSYGVRLPSGKTKGVLKFSYEFGELFAVVAPPLAKKAGEPLRGYPAAEAPPASNLAAAYLPPVHGEAPYPPPPGYLPQGYGYPPAVYGYAAPLPAYQKPPKRNGGKNFVLGSAGKFGGLLLIREMISDVWESVNDAGHDTGFDDGDM